MGDAWFAGGAGRRCSGGWDKLKELSKLSTSTAGRFSLTPPTISLSPQRAPYTSVCVPRCVYMYSVYLHSGGTQYPRRRGLYPIDVQTHKPSIVQFARAQPYSVIYLFIYSERLERSSLHEYNIRRFRGRISEDSAGIFHSLCQTFARMKSYTNLSRVSLKVQSSELVEGQRFALCEVKLFFETFLWDFSFILKKKKKRLRSRNSRVIENHMWQRLKYFVKLKLF